MQCRNIPKATDRRILLRPFKWRWTNNREPLGECIVLYLQSAINEGTGLMLSWKSSLTITRFAHSGFAFWTANMGVARLRL